ncbi:MAG TPA: hypothetical protein VJ576_06565 [Rhodocyclaceae bacterium]|nr:hypothetical protein [Rhodocyclaceae bacterium]
MTPGAVMAIMAEIEEGDPLDFSDLSVDSDDARALMALHFCELDRVLAEAGLSSEERVTVMAAIAAHVTEENMLLNVANLKRMGHKGDFGAWMRRYGLSGKN